MASFAEASRALLVTAHPDDEAMFFTPTILQLSASSCRVIILCLSTGNHYGLGAVRQQELRKACLLLGVAQHDVLVTDHASLQDGPGNAWSAELIASKIAEAVQAVSPDMILTFDGQGVSQHPNHIATWRGAVEYAKQCKQQLEDSTTGWAPPVFTLQTANLLGKYSGAWALVASYCLSWGPADAVCHNWNPLVAARAMAAHQSQYVWYRRIFIWMSQYSYVNMFNRL